MSWFASAKSDPDGKLAKTVTYYLSFLMLGMVVAILGPTLPTLADNTGSTLSAIGLVFTAKAMGSLLGAFWGGKLYDQTSGHLVMGLAFLLLAIMIFLIPVVSSFWVLMIVLFVSGIALGAFDVGGNTLIVWVHGHRVAPYMNGLHLFFGIGAFLAPVVVAASISWSDDISWAYWGMTFLMVPLILLLWRQASPSKQALHESAPSEAAPRLAMALMVLLFFFFSGAETGFGGWIYSYALAKNLGTEQSAALLTSGFWGAFTAGRLLAIPLATRVKPDTLLLWNLAGTLTGLCIILLGDSTSWIAWAGTLITGLSMAPVFPLLLAYAQSLVTMTGKTMRWFFIGAGIGAMTLPWIQGRLLEAIHPSAFLIAQLVILALSAVTFLILLTKTRQP